MIKNRIFDVYETMDKKALEAMAAAYEADLETVDKDFGRRDFIKGRLAIIYALLKHKIHADWLPTPENINALPEPVRKFIRDIETNIDPQGMVRENVLIKDTCKALAIKLEERAPMVDQAFVNIWADKYLSEGHIDYLRKQVKLMLEEAGVKVVKK